MQINPSRHSRSARKYVLLALIAISLFAVLFIFLRYTPVSPEGAYYDKYMANIGPAYWIFRDGSVFIVTPESTNIISTYSQLGNNWRYNTRTNTSTVLKATILGMTIISVEGGHTNTFYIPRRYLSWL